MLLKYIKTFCGRTQLNILTDRDKTEIVCFVYVNFIILQTIVSFIASNMSHFIHSINTSILK